ncbi:DUF4258 domain-containing protein [Spirosoma koreense]
MLLNEITDAILSGEIIEVSPNDHYGPSCLVLVIVKPATSTYTMPLSRATNTKDCYGLSTNA